MNAQLNLTQTCTRPKIYGEIGGRDIDMTLDSSSCRCQFSREKCNLSNVEDWLHSFQDFLFSSFFLLVEQWSPQHSAWQLHITNKVFHGLELEQRLKIRREMKRAARARWSISQMNSRENMQVRERRMSSPSETLAGFINNLFERYALTCLLHFLRPCPLWHSSASRSFGDLLSHLQWPQHLPS